FAAQGRSRPACETSYMRRAGRNDKRAEVICGQAIRPIAKDAQSMGGGAARVIMVLRPSGVTQSGEFSRTSGPDLQPNPLIYGGGNVRRQHAHAREEIARCFLGLVGKSV